jgi:glycosyltransferase involved in cell wall biosynthesis
MRAAELGALIALIERPLVGETFKVIVVDDGCEDGTDAPNT